MSVAVCSRAVDRGSSQATAHVLELVDFSGSPGEPRDIVAVHAALGTARPDSPGC